MKSAAVILLIAILASFTVSCGIEPEVSDMLSDFIEDYSADGIIYYSGAREGDDGHLDPETRNKLFLGLDKTPEHYAIFLNSHSDYGAECGVFFCDGTAELYQVVEMCEKRLSILRGGDKSLLIRSKNTVFYSTLSDRDRAEKLWREILRAYL